VRSSLPASTDGLPGESRRSGYRGGFPAVSTSRPIAWATTSGGHWAGSGPHRFLDGRPLQLRVGLRVTAPQQRTKKDVVSAGRPSGPRPKIARPPAGVVVRATPLTSWFPPRAFRFWRRYNSWGSTRQGSMPSSSPWWTRLTTHLRGRPSRRRSPLRRQRHPPRWPPPSCRR